MNIYIAKCLTCGKEFHTIVPGHSEAFATLCCQQNFGPYKHEIPSNGPQDPIEIRLAEAVVEWWDENCTGPDDGTFNIKDITPPPFVKLAEQLLAEQDDE